VRPRRGLRTILLVSCALASGRARGDDAGAPMGRAPDIEFIPDRFSVSAGKSQAAEPSETVAGQVLEPDGKPAAGALVQWSPSGLVLGLEETRERAAHGSTWTAKTDGQGRFVVKGLQPRFPGTLAAMSDAHTPVRRRVAPGSRDVVLRFPVGATVSGRVEAPGTSVPTRFTVELIGLFDDQDADSGRLSRTIMATMTMVLGGKDANLTTTYARRKVDSATGSFSLSGVGSGRYDVRVSTDDGRVGWSEELVVGDDSPPPVVVAVGKAALSGRLVDADTSKPVAGVDVFLSPQPGTPQSKTGADGRFEVASGAPGHTQVLFAGGPESDYRFERFMVRPTAPAGDVGDLLLRRRAKKERTRDVGLQIDPSLTGPFVTVVHAGTPAWAAGFRPGDHLVSVAGRRVDRLGPGSAEDLITDKAMVDVEVRRRGVAAPVRLHLKSSRAGAKR
jgi:hypothetical protein